METFGQKLRQAVEARGLRLEEVAQATGLGVEHIRALGRDDLAALPDDAIVAAGLRSLAHLLEVDPDEVIEDYRRERKRLPAPAPREVATAGTRDAHGAPAGIEPRPPQGATRAPAEHPGARAGRGVGIALPALAVLALAIVAFLFWPRSAPTSGPQRAEVQVPTPSGQTVERSPRTPVPPAGREVAPRPEPARPPDSQERLPAIDEPAGTSRLSVPEHGVGRNVVDHDLVGEATRFAEGERAWFWTRIEGGSAGDSIDHVWIHEGREALVVPVEIGGARWRTNSYKVLNPGSAGRWTVEARDSEGRVLARREFTCTPAP